MLENLFIIFIWSKNVILIHFPVVIIDTRRHEKILNFWIIITGRYIIQTFVQRKVCHFIVGTQDVLLTHI